MLISSLIIKNIKEINEERLTTNASYRFNKLNSERLIGMRKATDRGQRDQLAVV